MEKLISLAGIGINIKFIFRKTAENFRECRKCGIKAGTVCLNKDDLALLKREYLPQEWNSAGEMKMLAPLVSDMLLRYDRMIFHSVALYMLKGTWLLAAPSGTGKTTQYLNLKELHPEIQVICGDNPVLQFRQNLIEVHPSPWNGKENIGSDLTGILSGIILLKQGQENIIEPLSKEDAVLPVMNQINTFMKTEETVHMVCRLEEQLLKKIPVWKFINTGTKESSEMLYKYLKQYSEAGNDLQDN